MELPDLQKLEAIIQQVQASRSHPIHYNQADRIFKKSALKDNIALTYNQYKSEQVCDASCEDTQKIREMIFSAVMTVGFLSKSASRKL